MLADAGSSTTPSEKNIDDLLTSLAKNTSVLVKWFEINFFKMNPDKCKLLVCNYDRDCFIKIQDEIIQSSKSVKLLGITITNKLDFSEHVKKICNKANSKLHALARISKYISSDRLKILLRSFVESQFSYCPLIWMFHNRSLNNRINNLHERSLRLVYKKFYFKF